MDKDSLSREVSNKGILIYYACVKKMIDYKGVFDDIWLKFKNFQIFID
jgi:hypothetical protein